jgi:hypothetical protein
MSPSVVRPEVAAFVAQVRAYLSDLTPDEVEELAGGLEADLDERIAETLPGTAPADLGDPAAYAAELRAAAGLPPRGTTRRPQRPPLRDRLRERVRPYTDAVARQPWWPQTRESLVALRPAWWLLRAWVAFQILTFGAGLPGGLGQLLLLLLLAGLSVALGRGLLDARLGLPRRDWVRRVLVGLNVFAVVALPFGLAAVGGTNYVYVDESSGGSVAGLAMDGAQIGNIFAYDAQGNPIPLVQLYDQDGRPLKVEHQSWYDEAGTQVFSDVSGTRQVAPWVDDRGQARWNIFPLPDASVPSPTYGPNGEPTVAGEPSSSTAPPPLVAVPPVTGVYGVPGAEVPGASPSPSPSPSVSASPSVSPSASGKASASPTGSPAAATSATPSATTPRTP